MARFARRAVTGVPRPGCDGDLLGDLEGEPERTGRLSEELTPVIRGGELVEAEVAADDGEDLGVLGQAIRLELPPRELAPRRVAPRRVDRAQPALVLPRARAEVDPLIGQGAQAGAQPRRLRRTIVIEERELQGHGPGPGHLFQIEDVPHRESESRQHGATVQDIVDTQHDRFPGRSVDANGQCLRVHDPCQPGPRGEVFDHLSGDLGLGVALADDLDGQIGGNRGYRSPPCL